MLFLILHSPAGYEPWLENSTCSYFPQDYLDVADLHLTDFLCPETEAGGECSMPDGVPDLNLQLLEDPDQQDLESFTGTFGHYGLGNVTSYVAPTSGKLMLETGCGWVWEMLPLGNQTFIAMGTEPYWYSNYLTRFRRKEGAVADALTVYSTMVLSRFDRDLDWSKTPPPPEACL